MKYNQNIKYILLLILSVTIVIILTASKSVSSITKINGGGSLTGTDYLAITIDNKEYFVQSNTWGGAKQKIISGGESVLHVESFTRSPKAKPWDVGSYPSVLLGSRYRGYGVTKNSGMPVQVKDITSIRTGLSTNRMKLSNVDANTSYDVWFTNGREYNTANPDLAVLLMIWFGSNNVNPITSAGYTCKVNQPSYTTACPTHGSFKYKGKTFYRFVGRHTDGSIVMSYLPENPIDEFDFDLADFIKDASDQGIITPKMYLQNIQAGFEIIKNGKGLTINSFYADVK